MSNCRVEEGGDPDGTEPVSPGSEGSSEDAFVAHSSTDQLIAYDLPELGAGLKVRTERVRAAETSGQSPTCTGLDSPAKRRDLGPVLSPMKRGLWSPSAGRRLSLLTSAGERDSSLLTSFEAGAAWRLERTLYKLPSLREVREKVTWASVRNFLAVRTVQVPELGWAAYVFAAMAYGMANGRYGLSFYLGMQGLGYVVAGLDLVGN